MFKYFDQHAEVNITVLESHILNPLKGSGGRWLHFKVFSAIQV